MPPGGAGWDAEKGQDEKSGGKDGALVGRQVFEGTGQPSTEDAWSMSASEFRWPARPAADVHHCDRSLAGASAV